MEEKRKPTIAEMQNKLKEWSKEVKAKQVDIIKCSEEQIAYLKEVFKDD